MHIGERIRVARRALGLSQRALGGRLKMSGAAVAQWEAGETAPSSIRLREIADELKVAVTWLTGDSGEGGPPGADQELPEGLDRHEVRRANVRIPRLSEMPADVPIYGTTRAGDHQDLDDIFLLESGAQPIDWARRPPGVTSYEEVFGFYVEGDSMHPWKQAGDLVVVHRRLPPVIGGHVVVELRDPKTGRTTGSVLKRLLRRSSSKITLVQYNPDREIEIPVARVKGVFRVLTEKELIAR